MLGKILAVVCIAALVLVPAASAQTRPTQTSLTPEGESYATDWEKGLDRGSDADVFVNLLFCHGGPGLNPQQGSYTVTVELTPPEWMQIVSLPDPVVFTPDPAYGQNVQKCHPEAKANAKIRVLATAPFGEQGEISALVKVAEDSELAQSTYAPLQAEYTATIPVAVAEPEVDPITGQRPGDTNTTAPPTDTESNEGPAPAPLAVVLTLVALAALRRRKA